MCSMLLLVVQRIGTTEPTQLPQPCRGYTPKLAEVYTSLKKEGKSIEIVFVSSDRTEADFKEYYSEMPWVALPYADRAKKAELCETFEVAGIPRVLLLDPKTGKMTNSDARGDVVADMKGEKFPWAE